MARLLRCLQVLFGIAAVQLTLHGLILASDFTTFGLDLLGVELLALVCFVLMVVSRLLLIRSRSQRLSLGAMLGRPRCALLTLIAVLVCGVLANHRFELSRPELEAAVTKSTEKWYDNEGRWIGFYIIHGIDYGDDGRAFLDLGGCGFLDRCWLVFDTGTTTEGLIHTAKVSEHWYLRQLPF